MHQVSPMQFKIITNITGLKDWRESRLRKEIHKLASFIL
jgi:hypothetical protein